MERFKDKRKEGGVFVTVIGGFFVLFCNLNRELLLLRLDAIRCKRMDDSCNRGK
jgi:hypothetical protein